MSFRARPTGRSPETLYVETMRVAAALVLLVVPSSIASAQLCVGNTAFSISRMQGVANADFDRLANRFTLEMRVRLWDLFAGAEYGIKTWDVTSLGGTSQAVAVTLGLAGASPKARFGICPLVRWQWLDGPSEIGGGPWNFAEHEISGGLSVGALLSRTRLWDLIPTASITFGTGNPKLTTTSGGDLNTYQDWCCGRQSFTTLRLGLGLGFSDELTLVPAVTLPLGGERGVQKTYGLRAALRLGKGI